MVRGADLRRTQKLSKSHINVQYRRLHRFFSWLVEREYADSNPLQLIKPPSLDEKTVPVVTEDQVRDLLTLADPILATTPAHRFRLTRSRALLYMLWDTPGRLTEISKLRLEDMDLEAGAVLVMGKGRKEPIGAAATSALLGYVHEREKLSPATDACGYRNMERHCCPAGSSKSLNLGHAASVRSRRLWTPTRRLLPRMPSKGDGQVSGRVRMRGYRYGRWLDRSSHPSMSNPVCRQALNTISAAALASSAAS